MIVFIILLGFIVNIFAYANIWSTVTFVFCFILSKLVSRLIFGKNISHKNRTEDILSIWLISICYLFSGITEFLIVFYNDSRLVVGPDATRFFEAASNPLWDFRDFISDSYSGYAEEAFKGFKEDFVPILVWNKIYSFLTSINFPIGRYIGSSINTFLLVITSYIGLDLSRNTLKLSRNKEILYIFLFCSNGMFWMFGSIHIRESNIMLIISLLVYIWIKWIIKKEILNTIFLLLLSACYLYTLDFFRGGLSNIPLIFFIAYFLTILIKSLSERKILFWRLAVLVGVPILLIVYSPDLSYFKDLLTERFNYYNESSITSSGNDSLGLKLIINQPIYIRFFTSFIYILFNPFPIWAGQENNAISMYHVFKSTFAIYNYITFPAIILIINNQFRNLKTINPYKLFLTISFILITIILSFTSMETRHLAGFYLIYILIMLDFDFSSKIFIKNYISLLSLFFLLLFIAYMLYIFYKFKSISLLMIFIGSILITFSHANKHKLNKFLD